MPTNLPRLKSARSSSASSVDSFVSGAAVQRGGGVAARGVVDHVRTVFGLAGVRADSTGVWAGADAGEAGRPTRPASIARRARKASEGAERARGRDAAGAGAD